MERLTKPGSDYCTEICGQAGTCSRKAAGELCKVCSIYAKLAAYEDAEEDGRLLVLPCKEGTAVYCLRHDTFTDENGESWSICSDKRRHIETVPFFDGMRQQVGKTVFLTREEAEAALGGAE